MTKLTILLAATTAAVALIIGGIAVATIPVGRLRDRARMALP